jgi:hypothetical protein
VEKGRVRLIAAPGEELLHPLPPALARDCFDDPLASNGRVTLVQTIRADLNLFIEKQPVLPMFD